MVLETVMQVAEGEKTLTVVPSTEPFMLILTCQIKWAH